MAAKIELLPTMRFVNRFLGRPVKMQLLQTGFSPQACHLRLPQKLRCQPVNFFHNPLNINAYGLFCQNDSHHFVRVAERQLKRRAPQVRLTKFILQHGNPVCKPLTEQHLMNQVATGQPFEFSSAIQFRQFSFLNCL